MHDPSTQHKRDGHEIYTDCLKCILHTLIHTLAPFDLHPPVVVSFLGPKLEGFAVKPLQAKEETLKVLFIISTDEAETIYNALRMANVGLQKGDEISVFMLGKAVGYESVGGDDFDVLGQVKQFTEEGDFYV